MRSPTSHKQAADAHAIKPAAPGTPVPVDAESALFREPYQRLRPEFDALAADQLLIPNFDIVLGATIALGALPAIRAMRSQIVAELPRFDHARGDRLEDYIRAAAYAHARFVAAATPSEPLPVINALAVKLRDSLLVSADALADHGVFPAERLAEIRRGRGYRDTSTDLVALSAMFRAAWKDIGTRTAVVVADLDRAESLANQLLVAVARHDHTDPAVVAAMMARRRAVTAFVKVYDQARRAAAYLRWDFGDADTLVPSVYVHTTAPKKRAAGASTGAASTASPTHAPPVVDAAHAAPPAGVPHDDPVTKS